MTCVTAFVEQVYGILSFELQNDNIKVIAILSNSKSILFK